MKSGILSKFMYWYIVSLAAVNTPMSAMYSALVGMRPSLEQMAASSAEPR